MGKKVTGQWPGQQLQSYVIRPKTLRIGEERAKGYEWEDFKEVFRRYIPKSEIEAFKAEIREQVAKREEKAPADGCPGAKEGRASGKDPAQAPREERGENRDEH